MTRRLAAALLLLALARPTRAEEDRASLRRDAREHLRALLRLDTTNPPGNEILAADYLKRQLDKAAIPSAVYASSPSRASLIARLAGSGAERPLILMCHTDVVPADPKTWSVEPFSAQEQGGYLYGRGAADNKGLCAAQLAVLLWLKRQGTPLSRDVVLFAQADEESGSAERHILWLLKEHGRELEAEFALNEGGNLVLEGERVAEVRVEAAEKTYVDIFIRARGSAGHASVPRSDNAVATLAEAVVRLSRYRAPAELSPIVREFLRRQVPTSKPQLQAALRAALQAAPGRELDEAADALTRLKPEWGAMLRDTLAPTRLKAGEKSNVIPAEANAVFNARLLPGRDPELFLGGLRPLLEDLSVELGYEFPGRGPSSAMPTDTRLYRALEEAAAAAFPEARTLPFMAAWTTDSQALRARGVVTYGISIPLSEDDLSRVHGVDERVWLPALDRFAEFLLDAVLRTAGAAAPPEKTAP